jgi:hypothetical protein
MDLQFVFNTAASVIVGAVGWLLNKAYASVKEIRRDVDKHDREHTERITQLAMQIKGLESSIGPSMDSAFSKLSGEITKSQMSMSDKFATKADMLEIKRSMDSLHDSMRQVHNLIRRDKQ